MADTSTRIVRIKWNLSALAQTGSNSIFPNLRVRIERETFQKNSQVLRGESERFDAVENHVKNLLPSFFFFFLERHLVTCTVNLMISGPNECDWKTIIFFFSRFGGFSFVRV